MKVFYALIACAVILSGCTTYKPSGFAGGFEETPLAANAYKIKARGNAFASPAKVRAIALVRAAELTMNNGYDRFIVHSLEDWQKSQTVMTSPGRSQSFGSAIITPGIGGSGGYVTGQSTTTFTPPSYATFSKPHSELVVQMLKRGDAGYENGLIPRQIFASYGPTAGYKGSLYDPPRPSALPTEQSKKLASSSTISPPKTQPTSNQQSAIRQGEATRGEYPIALRWEGVSDLATGKLTVSGKGTEGGLSANVNADVGHCTGNWERKGSKPQDYGVWYMRCDRGLTASGTYRMTGKRDGEGDGRDANGRSIEFLLGAEASRALSKTPKRQNEQHVKQDSVETRLKKVQELLDRGLITEGEAAEKRNEILKNL